MVSASNRLVRWRGSERDDEVEPERARLAREVDRDAGELGRVEGEVLVDGVVDVADPSRQLDVAGRRAVAEPHVVQVVLLLADRVAGERRLAVQLDRATARVRVEE